MNERLPLMEWESEVRVVKQSASSMVSMLVVMAAGIVPMVVLVAMPGVSGYIVYGVLVALMAGFLGCCHVLDRRAS